MPDIAQLDPCWVKLKEFLARQVERYESTSDDSKHYDIQMTVIGRLLSYVQQGILVIDDLGMFRECISRIFPDTFPAILSEMFLFHRTQRRKPETGGPVFQLHESVSLNTLLRSVARVRSTFDLPRSSNEPIIFVPGTTEEFMAKVRPHLEKLEAAGELDTYPYSVAEGEAIATWLLKIVLMIAYPDRLTSCYLATPENDWRHTLKSGHVVTIGAADSNIARAKIVNDMIGEASDGKVSMDWVDDPVKGTGNERSKINRFSMEAYERFEKFSGLVMSWLTDVNEREKVKKAHVDRYLILRKDGKNILYDAYNALIIDPNDNRFSDVHKGFENSNGVDGRRVAAGLVSGRRKSPFGDDGFLCACSAGVNTHGTASATLSLSDPATMALLDSEVNDMPVGDRKPPFCHGLVANAGKNNIHPVLVRFL